MNIELLLVYSWYLILRTEVHYSLAIGGRPSVYHLSSCQGAVNAGEEEDFPQVCPDLPVPPVLCTYKVDSIKGSSFRRFFSDQTHYFFHSHCHNTDSCQKHSRGCLLIGFLSSTWHDSRYDSRFISDPRVEPSNGISFTIPTSKWKSENWGLLPHPLPVPSRNPGRCRLVFPVPSS